MLYTLLLSKTIRNDFIFVEFSSKILDIYFRKTEKSDDCTYKMKLLSNLISLFTCSFIMLLINAKNTKKNLNVVIMKANFFFCQTSDRD